jgi:hypothetical protein
VASAVGEQAGELADAVGQDARVRAHMQQIVEMAGLASGQLVGGGS